VCAVLARVDGGEPPAPDAPTGPMTLPTTRPMWEREPRREALAQTVARHHGKVEALADGALLVTLGGLGEGTDQAARAARCAIAIHAVIPEAPMAVVAGRGTPTARMPAGEVLDRGVALLGAGPAGRRSPAPAGAEEGADIREGEPREGRQQKLRARGARHVLPRDVARVTWFLGELAGVPFSEKESVELRAARHDPVLMGDQMRRAFDDLLLAECASQPL